jgi:hypothetical protein
VDGVLLRLDSGSKLDYFTHDEGRDERMVLGLASGGLYLRLHDGRQAATYDVETPGGRVEVVDRGLYRVDVDAGEVRLSVYDGQATLDSGRRRVEVDAGERSYSRRGEIPEAPRRFDAANEQDDFSRWADDRERREAWAADSRRYLPADLDAYAGEFEGNGTWQYENEVGYVWRPSVAVGWQPYVNGRWLWTSYGWTWCPNEAWGWAPFHYGRWGFSGALGWYWIPGRTWGPGWVSWAVGPNYVGWAPLGYRDRAIVYAPRYQGNAVPRGTVASGWSFVRRADMGARDLAVRRVDAAPQTFADVRVAESPRLRPTRDFRELREVAVPRFARTKPVPGDTVPELAFDREASVPSPWVSPTARGAQANVHPTDTRSPARNVNATAVPRMQGQKADQAPRAIPTERDREVIRTIFQGISDPKGQGDGDKARPRDDAARSKEDAARASEAQARARDDAARARDDARRREESRPRNDDNTRARQSPPPRQESHPSPPPPDKSRSQQNYDRSQSEVRRPPATKSEPRRESPRSTSGSSSQDHAVKRQDR